MTNPEAEQAQQAEHADHPHQGGADAASSTGGAGPEADAGTERLEKAVRAAENALIEFEIAVETFRVEVENFSRLHHQRLGPMYARLDELDAQIAEATAARTGDPEDLRRADEARAIVMPMPGVEELFQGWIDSDGLSPEGTAMLNEQPVQPPSRVRPGEEARKAYRELVRKAHPDLAQDEAEQERREAFMVRVNKAYTAGDTDALRQLAAEWEAGPAEAERPPSRSEELYDRLEWLAARKEMLASAVEELEGSAIGAMLRMAPDDPDGLLDEIAEQLLAQVSEREARLAELLAQPSPEDGGAAAPVGARTAPGTATGADPVPGAGADPAPGAGPVAGEETDGGGGGGEGAPRDASPNDEK
ncbi:J domain-containing protein [Streptomyces sp. Z26]|uniref:J domain-containing protein n=1 Tax=Streptomyces sp. Z26 TaxID=2500177 RepID=UPI001F0C7B6A|nr:J domain-containing protein [Streptomyces sp. Z26]